MAEALSQIGDILTAVAALLAGVSGVKRVYTYELVAIEAGQIPETMGPQNDIHYWTVRPETTQPVRQVGYQVDVDHVIVLRGNITLGDAAVTTPVVDALIRAIQTAFAGVYEIAGEAEVVGELATTWPRPVVLADTFLVHQVEFRLPVHEYLVRL